MAYKKTPLGPGTLTLGTDPGATDLSCQILSGGVNHEYEDVGEERTVLCGDVIPAGARRSDSLTFNLLADLYAGGVYEWLLTHDLEEADFEYTPHTTTAAKWAGKVQVRVPDSVAADEFGADLEGEVTLPGVGQFEFTAAVAVP